MRILRGKMAKFIQPDPSKVLIIDISKWQDDPNTLETVDFVQLKSQGTAGVIVKCGEANAIDRAFISYVQEMKKYNIPFGVYWYYNNKYPPKKQAKLFVDTLIKNNVNPKLGMWLDLEDRNPGKYTGWKYWYDFLLQITNELPERIVGIYTGHYYFTEYTTLAGIPPQSLAWFAKFPLWIASYGSSPKYTKPWGDDWLLWQFTDLLDGIKFGVDSKELDGNYFNGDIKKFCNYFKIDDVSPQIRWLVRTIYEYSDGYQEIVEELDNDRKI